MTTLKVGIASYQEMKARTMAVARGERRVAASEPKVWFTSTESFAKVLSAGNRELLRVVVEKTPTSLDEFGAHNGSACKSNLSRTLKTMENYGLVQLVRGERGRITPRVIYDRVSVQTCRSLHHGKRAKPEAQTCCTAQVATHPADGKRQKCRSSPMLPVKRSRIFRAVRRPGCSRFTIENVVLDLNGQLVGVANRMPAAVRVGPLHAAVLILIEELVAGLAGPPGSARDLVLK